MPTTRFAVISDTHYVWPPTERDGTLWNRQLLTRTGELAELLLKALGPLDIEFIIHCGDLTHEGDPESIAFTRQVLNRTGLPVIFALGNHDTAYPDVRELLKELFELEAETFYFSRYLKGLRWLVLDANYAHLPSGEESLLMQWRQAKNYAAIGFNHPQLAWLEAELKRDQRTPTFVNLHWPLTGQDSYPRLYPREPADPELRLEPPPAHFFPKYHREVLKLLAGQRNVRAFFAGHWHINHVCRYDSVHQILSSSLIEYPFEFRVVEVNDDTLILNTQRLGDADLQALSVVPEWCNTWVAGLAVDRDCYLL